MSSQALMICERADRAVLLTHDGALYAATLQTARQVNDLLSTSVEVTAGFNVNHFHRLAAIPQIST